MTRYFILFTCTAASIGCAVGSIVAEDIDPAEREAVASIAAANRNITTPVLGPSVVESAGAVAPLIDESPLPERDPDPGMPASTRVNEVTFIARTGPYASSESTQTAELCLNQDLCFPLVPDHGKGDFFRRGGVEVLHFDELDIPRSEITELKIRSLNGPDGWIPSCFQLLLNGKPTYYRELGPIVIGTDPTDVHEWTDSLELHSGIGGCMPSGLTHGPMMGPPEPTSAKIWLRTDATRRVGIRLGMEEDLSDAPVFAWAYPSPNDDFTFTIDLDGLWPNTTYHYGVEVDGYLVRTAQFTTAPPISERGHVRIGFGANAIEEAQEVFSAIEGIAPDFFVFLGNNFSGPRGTEAAHQSYHREARSDLHRSSMSRAIPTLATWSAGDFDPSAPNGWNANKYDALDVFADYWPQGTGGNDETPGTFFRHSYGDVELFVLDTRFHRGVDGSALGSAQAEWLRQALRSSRATFKLIASAESWSSPSDDDELLSSREAILNGVRGVEGVMLLSGGGEGRAEVRTIEREGEYDLHELITAPLAGLEGSCDDSTSLFCAPSNSSFLTLEIDTSERDAVLEASFRNASGEALFTIEFLESALRHPDCTIASASRVSGRCVKN